jgi:hypothetical protein
MKKSLFYTLFVSVLLCGTVGWLSNPGDQGFFASLFGTGATANFSTNSTDWLNKEISVLSSEASNISTKALKAGLEAYLTARKRGLDQKQVLTIIDYSKPDSERRLLVVDLKSNKVLFNTYVAHGKNSGDLYATSFSNRPGSLKSSIGVFVTDEPYVGHEGYSLRISGLEPGINDNAYERATVIHGAWYVSKDVVQKYGQLGRSWGCPAVNPSLIKPIINTIKENTLVVAYYPDRHWLNNSTFLAG